MAPKLINITLGTAGHIDHGKTALVKNLTGCDTDHLKEEKLRGMSIELGFAPCTISDMEVGIVDVPGHENFVRTMVAGAAGMDGVILIVAADDGVMTQTREHLDILTLLGIRYGIIALTKADRVEPDHIELVCAQVRDLLAATFLEKAPIVPVSNVTGSGYDLLLEELRRLVDSIEPKRTDGLFRLPVERSFSVKGYGTVVTGIPVSGSARLGDELILMPQSRKGRLKAIQVYKHTADTVLAGQCAALNIPQLDHTAIDRGNVIVADACFAPQTWYLCSLRTLPDGRPSLRNGSKVKFHTGTSEVPASIYLMHDGDLPPGSESLVQIRLDKPLVAAPADRFIIRDLSPVRTIGGGMVIDALQLKLKRSSPLVREDAAALARAVLDDAEHIEYRLRKAPACAASAAELAASAKLPLARVQAVLTRLTADRKAERCGELFIHADSSRQLQERLLGLIAAHHDSSPHSPGIEPEPLRNLAELDKDVFQHIVAGLSASGSLAQRNGRLALPSHRDAIPEAHRDAAEKVEALFRARHFNPPSLEEVAAETGLSPSRADAIIRLLIENQRLVVVEKGLFFHAEAVAKACEILQGFIQKEGVLESVKFKYLLSTTRKYAIPLLDYFDRIGVTRRAGHSRYLPQKP